MTGQKKFEELTATDKFNYNKLEKSVLLQSPEEVGLFGRHSAKFVKCHQVSMLKGFHDIKFRVFDKFNIAKIVFANSCILTQRSTYFAALLSKNY
jgi:hypothetical protein